MSELTLLVVFPALMAYAAASDLLTMTIPNRLSLALVVGFAAFALVSGLPPMAIGLHIGAGLAILVVTFGLFAAGWIGGGDAKLAAATALWLGFDALPGYLFAAALAGGVLTVAIVAFRFATLPRFAADWPWLKRLHDPAAGIPYGIALAAAALLVYPHSHLFVSTFAR